MGLKRDSGQRILPNLYGYDPDTSKWNPFAPVVVSEKKTIVEIYRLFLYHHKPANSIAVLLNISPNHKPRKLNAKVGFTPRFVMKVLTRLEYCGLTKNSSGQIIKSEIYEEIIPYDNYLQVSRFLSKKKELHLVGSDQLIRYPLTGFMTCKLCEKRYYIKYSTDDKRIANYYYHYTKGCYSPSLIKPNAIHELVYATFIFSFTSRTALTIKLESFARIMHPELFSSPYSTIDKEILSLWQYYQMNNLLNQNLIKMKTGMMSLSQYHIEIEALIEDIVDDKNRNYIEEFIEYLGNVLKAWYSGTPNSKVDSLLNYIESISIEDNKLLIQPFDSELYEINFDPPTEYWAKKVTEYRQLRTETFDSKSKKLSVLTDYLYDLCEIISDEQATGLLTVANKFIEDNILTQNSFLKNENIHYLEVSSFLNISNATSKQKTVIILKSTKDNRVYLRHRKENQEIKAYLMDDRVVGYELSGETYFNQAFLHSLPEWFYHYNAEYFKIEREKICFIKNEDGIKSFILGNLGKKTEIPFHNAVEKITNGKNVHYIPVE